MEKAKAAAELLLDFYQEMGYSVVAVGQKDLAAGLDFLKNSAASRGIILISANLTKNGKKLFPSDAVVEKNGVNIGFTAVTSCNVVRYHRGEIECITPETALSSELPALRERCDFVVLLSNAGDGVNRRIAAKFPEIDLIIKSGYGSKTYTPRMYGIVPYVMTHPKGKSVAFVTLKKTGEKGRRAIVKNNLILLTTKYPLDKSAQAKVDAFEAQFARQVARPGKSRLPSPVLNKVEVPGTGGNHK